MKWCGSSAWLEYMPVTHGVAGSSPVRTACKALISFEIKAFLFLKCILYASLGKHQSYQEKRCNNPLVRKA